MAFLHHYLAAVRGKITSDNHLHTNGCSLPKQFLLFPKDIGKELLPPGSLHPSGLLGCLYRWCRQQAPWCSRFRAMRTMKKQKLYPGEAPLSLSKNNTNQVWVRSVTFVLVTLLLYVNSKSKSTYWWQASSVMLAEQVMEDLDKSIETEPCGIGQLRHHPVWITVQKSFVGKSQHL